MTTLESILYYSSGLSGLVFFYCLYSIPTQFVRRFRRKKKGESISPFSLILKNILKNWGIAAIIIIPVTSILIFAAGQDAGLHRTQIIHLIMINSIFGNILTSLLFGYALMVIRKDSWSVSALEEVENSDKKEVE